MIEVFPTPTSPVNTLFARRIEILDVLEDVVDDAKSADVLASDSVLAEGVNSLSPYGVAAWSSA